MSYAATQKEDQNWFSRPIIAKGRSKVLQNAPSILQYFRPSLIYTLSLKPLFFLFWSGRLRQVLLHIVFWVSVIMFILDENNVTSAPATALRLNSEWGQPWGSQFWIVSVTCRLYLPENYTPQEKFQGFYIQLSMDNHATHISEVYFHKTL